MDGQASADGRRLFASSGPKALIRTLEHFACFRRHAEDAELEAGTAGVENKYLHKLLVI